MQEYYKKCVRLAYCMVFLFLIAFPFQKTTGQEEIEQEMFKKDSLINRVGKQNVDTSYTWEWNKDSSRWEPYGRDLNFYKQDQKLLAKLNQRWNPEKDTFLNEQRSIKSYNNKNLVVESLQQEWNTNRNEWVNLKLKTITYEKGDKKSQILYQEWKRAVGRWVNTTRYLIDYNRLGEKSNIMIKAYSPEEDRWYNHQRYLFQYEDGFGPPNAAIVQNWSKSEQEWKKKGRYTMKYNHHGKKTMESRATWNQSIKEYINGIRYLIDYEKKNKTREVLQHWDFADKSWNNKKQHKFKYDEEGDLKEELTYRWNNENQQWVLKRRLKFSMKKPDLNQNKEPSQSQSG